ncbi:MAG: VCBS repeat-containing protein [Candidatus Sumerlaeia bacterium]|nr:VCBS repeat-containing protein [Candidatus Sumerlaeia bacterium]
MRTLALLVFIAIPMAVVGAKPKQAAPKKATAFPAFQYHVIDRIGRQLGQTALADLDRDGDLDWVCGQSRSAGADIWWWEYQAPDKWVRHMVGKGNTEVGAAVRDLNGDGWLDILSGSKLLINSGDPRNKPFAEYEVGAAFSHDTVFADINGDGKMDALANCDRSGLFWYEIPADPTRRWTSHTIALASAHKIHGATSPRPVGDLDGDGDADVVTGQAWYENADGKGLKWVQHKNINFGEVQKYGIALKTWVLDLDGDGDNDFIQAEADHPDARVAWFENDGKGNWTMHLIKDKGEKQDFHSLAVADFDNDGDLDVFSGGGPLSVAGEQKCYIWENLAGPKGRPTADRWREHVIVKQTCHEAVAADVDGDGDIDICSKPWSDGNEHYYLRNMLMEKK